MGLTPGGMGCEQGSSDPARVGGRGTHSFASSHRAGGGRKRKGRKSVLGGGVATPAPSFCGSPGQRWASRSRPRGSPRSGWDPSSLPVTLEQTRLDAVPGPHFSRFPLVFPSVFPSAQGSRHERGAAWPGSLRKRRGFAFIGGKRELPAASPGSCGRGGRGTACRRAGASPWGKKIHLPALGKGQSKRWQLDFPAHPKKNSS